MAGSAAQALPGSFIVRNKYQKLLVHLLFFLSGSTGLIYEIIWSRKLGLVFGSTVYAVSTVLTVFFTGLALGAWLIGREMDRGRNPLKTYVTLELLLGVFGIASPLIFIGIDTVYYHIQPWVASQLAALTAVRFALSFLGLLIPTTLMGATLPVLVKLVVTDDEDVAADAGRLYAINTLGAALGTLLAAIALIPLFGVNGSLYLAGGINLAIAAVAFLAFRNTATPTPTATPAARAPRTPLQNYLLAIFAAIGFVSMVYQVAWIRLLIQVTGSTVYTFGLMLSVFIVGVGLGSDLCARALRRIPNKMLALALVELAASAYALFGLGYFDRLPLVFTSIVSGVDSFAGVLLAKLFINVLVLLFPTLMFGAAFPLVASIYAGRAEHSGGDVGLIYSANTIGGVFGSFAGGFLILPLLGTQTSIAATSVVGLAIAATIALRLADRTQRIAGVAVCSAALVVGLLLNTPWDRFLINSGPFLLQYSDTTEMQRAAGAKRRVFYDKEGVNVNVYVDGLREPTRILINGKPMASTLIMDVANQYLLGHIPMLLHPNPKTSMVIGLGAGMTFGALARHPGTTADVIEISPEVVEGARLFGPYNRYVLDQPNANVIFDDGRNYLKTTRKKYDVITEDPLDPFFMGSGYLYDLEHFQNAKAALNPGGIMCQYLPLYQVGVEEARIIVKTFAEVFPHVSGWFAFSDLVLIGSQEPLRIDLANLRRRMERPEIRQDLLEVGIDNEYDFLANFLFDDSEIAAIGGDLPLNTDNYPIIEYLTPRALMRRTELENVEYFLGKRAGRFPGILELDSLTPSEFREFNQRMSRYYVARSHIIKAHILLLKGGKGMLEELASAERAVSPLETSSRYRAFIYRGRGDGLLARKQDEAAAGYYEKSDALEPNQPKTLNGLAQALLRTGKSQRAVELFERSLALDEGQLLPRPFIAGHLIETGNLPAARSMLTRCLELEPTDEDCLELWQRIEPGPSANAES
jgi:spermidine synthase